VVPPNAPRLACRSESQTLDSNTSRGFDYTVQKEMRPMIFLAIFIVF
jgi:hypothetical protein